MRQTPFRPAFAGIPHASRRPTLPAANESLPQFRQYSRRFDRVAPGLVNLAPVFTNFFPSLAAGENPNKRLHASGDLSPVTAPGTSIAWAVRSDYQLFDPSGLVMYSPGITGRKSIETKPKKSS
jgi:hypothetical protein